MDRPSSSDSADPARSPVDLTVIREPGQANVPFFAADFADASHGWVVGAHALVAATRNGGKSWFIRHHGGHSFVGVDFVDPRHGWGIAVDMELFEGFVLVSEDGGESWRPQLEGLAWPKAIEFVDRKNGWLVDGDGQLHATRDGGETWEVLFQPEAPLRSIVMLDMQNGWALQKGNHVLATRDGGRSWRSLLRADRLIMDVTFVDPRHGWAVGESGLILATDDGGETWREQQSDRGETLSKVAFGDAMSGWIVGSGGVVLSTRDGGATWITQGGSGLLFNGLAAGGPDLAVVVGSLFTPNTRGLLLSNHDGSEDWLEHHLEQPTLVAADFIDHLRGWAVGGDGEILASDDGGRSWRELHRTAPRLLDIAFADARRGWAVGFAGQILATRDGGRSWTEQRRGDERLYLLSVIDAERVTALGMDEEVLATVDGGETWLQLPGLSGQTLGVVGPADSAGGGDGGPETAAIPRPEGFPGPDVRDFVFLDRRVGWAVAGALGASDSSILATLDGGISWTIQHHGEQILRGIAFADARHGWAVGRSGVVLTTANGGKTWDSLEPIFGGDYWDVEAVDPSTALIFGQGGVVIRARR